MRWLSRDWLGHVVGLARLVPAADSWLRWWKWLGGGCQVHEMPHDAQNHGAQRHRRIPLPEGIAAHHDVVDIQPRVSQAVSWQQQLCRGVGSMAWRGGEELSQQEPRTCSTGGSWGKRGGRVLQRRAEEGEVGSMSLARSRQPCNSSHLHCANLVCGSQLETQCVHIWAALSQVHVVPLHRSNVLSRSVQESANSQCLVERTGVGPLCAG